MKDFGSRLHTVGLVPTLLAVGAVVFLAAARAPSTTLTWQLVTTTVNQLGTTGALAVSILGIAIAVTLQPLQFRFVQLLEGYWPIGRRGLIFRAGVRVQHSRYQRLQKRLVSHAIPRNTGELRATSERMQSAETRLRERFPDPERLLPTSLGNVLRSAEDRVGRRYGLESVTIWPRLFPLLPADLRAAIEDEVTQLDVSARLALTWSGAATAATIIMLNDASAALAHPAWLAVVAGLWLLGWLSYLSAVESALAHGQDIEVALDLHRGLVIEAMRLPPPPRLSQERRIFRRLCRLFQTYEAGHSIEFDYLINERRVNGK